MSKSEIVTEAINKACAHLFPLLDDEETKPVAITILKAIDLGLNALENQQNLTAGVGLPQEQPKQDENVQGALDELKDMGVETTTQAMPMPSHPQAAMPHPDARATMGQGGLPVAAQNVVINAEEQKAVADMVASTLDELEGMETDAPTYETKEGEQAEYVKGMLCNCQFASEFHKYCDNQCKEALIKATGDTKTYMNYLNQARGEEEDKDLDDAVNDVASFIDEGLGLGSGTTKQTLPANAQGVDGQHDLDRHKGGPYPKAPNVTGEIKVDNNGNILSTHAINTPEDDPIEELTGEKNEGNPNYQPAKFALNPDLPVVMPGEDGIQHKESYGDE